MRGAEHLECAIVDQLDLECLIYQWPPFPYLATRMTVQVVGQGSSSSRKKLKDV